jgi:CDP-diacylglycerol---serine O-phosphatidyltransferase
MNKFRGRAKSEMVNAHIPSVWLRALPHLFTLAALVAGLTGITAAIDGHLPQAIGCILLAGFLDACDGRVARFVGTNSQFGAELDSLSDVICFGAAPALVVYLWGMKDFGWLGWLTCMTLTCATALRLARFNVAVNNPNKPSWSAAFFQGVPAPAGAFLALLPIYLENADLLSSQHSQMLALFWLPIVAFLMFSTLPTFSGKLLGRVMARARVLLLICAVGIAVIVATFGVWTGLVVMVVGYLAVLPLSLWRHVVLNSRG